MEGICFYQPSTPEDGLKNIPRYVRVSMCVRQLNGNEKYNFLSASHSCP